MAMGLARAAHQTYLLLRMEAEEFGLSVTLPASLLGNAPDAEVEEAFEHPHSETCSCHLRGE